MLGFADFADFADFAGFADVVEITPLNTSFIIRMNCTVMNLSSYSVLSLQTTVM